LKLKDGEEIKFDKAFIAPGGRARTLNVPGKELQGIHVLREPKDAAGINSEIEGKDVVIVGSSFIGLETAAIIAKKVKSVLVIGMEKVAFERVLGVEIGTALQALHERNGVKFVMERVVHEFLGADGKAIGVKLDNGAIINGEVFIIGAGIIPNTEFILGKDGSLASSFARDGSIITNKFMQMEGATDIYIGGDIARYPYPVTQELIRVEHYGIAQYHGRVAAKNLVGKEEVSHSIPFFWTTHYGKSVRYAGHATSYDKVVVDAPPNLKTDNQGVNFAAYYFRNGQLLAVAAVGRDPLASEWAEKFASGCPLPSPDHILSLISHPPPPTPPSAAPSAPPSTTASAPVESETPENQSSSCLLS
jgi:NADPH-dependent 2,4-dienoyl-CoA reductase/sulfur reductase-like enzyme